LKARARPWSSSIRKVLRAIIAQFVHPAATSESIDGLRIDGLRIDGLLVDGMHIDGRRILLHQEGVARDHRAVRAPCSHPPSKWTDYA